MVENKRHRSHIRVLSSFLTIAYTDHPKVIRTTQPSTMGGPLGDPRFWTLDSTAIMCCCDSIWKRNFHQIWIASKKSLVKRPPIPFHFCRFMEAKVNNSNSAWWYQAVRNSGSWWFNFNYDSKIQPTRWVDYDLGEATIIKIVNSTKHRMGGSAVTITVT